MAESRRVQLTTLSCCVVPPSSDHPVSALKPPPNVLRQEEIGPDRSADTGSVRLVLMMFEPNERSFPEFSYTQLIDNEINLREDKEPLSKFEEDEKRENAEVAAIARKLEKKYSGKPKKKKDRIQDLIDIGYGYDEEDSFIDNSEAYDEFVPASISTKYGGFYVNSGMLQFRQASDTETETEDLTKDKTLESSKKRKLNSGREFPKKKQYRADGEMQSNMDLKSSTLSETGPNDEMKRKKKKKGVGTLSVTSMLKKFQREKEKEQKKMDKAIQKAAGIMGKPTIPLCPADAAGGGGSGLTDPLLSLIGSTNDHALIQAASTMDFDIDLVSLLDASEEASSSQPPTQLFPPKTNDHSKLNVVLTEAQPPNTKTNLQLKSHPEQVQQQASSTSLHQCVSLPEGLTPDLEDSIRKLMLAAKTSEGESKLKFFTPEINLILLDIELQCRERGGQLRSKVYTHLSSFLPCSRDTLLKRVKKLLLTQMKDRPDVEDPLQKLKEAICKVMPEQIACYLEKCQLHEQVKVSKTPEEGDESKQNVNAGLEDNVEDRGGKKGGPKKLFRWNEEIRECLYHVLKPKMDKYIKLRKGSQEVEEYLKTLLDSEIKPIWPKGWMQSRVLMRESRKLLGFFISLSVKKVRSDKKQSPIHGTPTMKDALQGTPSVTGELPRETDEVFTDGSEISSSMSLDDVRKEATVLKNQEIPAESSTSLVNASSASTHVSLDFLANQALAREQPLMVSHELLAAALAKYKNSLQHWSFGADTQISPIPPPTPQSSPVDNLPVSRMETTPLEMDWIHDRILTNA